MNLRLLSILGALAVLSLVTDDASAFGRKHHASCCPPVYSCSPCPPICCYPFDLQGGQQGGNQGNQGNQGGTDAGPPPKEKIHVLGVFATDDPKLKISLTKSADRFEKKIPFLMESSKRLPGDKIKMLKGADCSKEKILDFCNNVPSTSDDIIFVFIACHGQVTGPGMHTLVNLGPKQDQTLERSAILDALKKRPNQLIVLITDSCAEFAPGVSTFATGTPTQWKQCVLKSLLLDTKGIVDINSASPGQLAWSSNQVGALMTDQFLQLAEQEIKTLDKNGDGKISWKDEFFPVLQKKTNDSYISFQKKGIEQLDPATDAWDALKKQKLQEPFTFSTLPGIAGAVSLAPANGAAAAKVHVVLPADAKLWLDDVQTKSNGAERQFISPPLPAGKSFFYMMKVAMPSPEGTVVLTQKIQIEAGRTTEVNVQLPKTFLTKFSD